VSKASREGPTARPRVRRRTILTGAAVILVAALVAIPLRRDCRHFQNPAVDAETTCRDLLAKIGGPEGAPIVTGSVRNDSVQAVEGGVYQPRLRRNLFAPGPWGLSRASRSETSVKPARKLTLPKLTGVLIDGASRQAMIAGRLVGRDEVVEGYRVVKIEPGFVILEREGATYRLGRERMQ